MEANKIEQENLISVAFDSISLKFLGGLIDSRMKAMQVDEVLEYDEAQFIHRFSNPEWIKAPVIFNELAVEYYNALREKYGTDMDKEILQKLEYGV